MKHTNHLYRPVAAAATLALALLVPAACSLDSDTADELTPTHTDSGADPTHKAAELLMDVQMADVAVIETRSVSDPQGSQFLSTSVFDVFIKEADASGNILSSGTLTTYDQPVHAKASGSNAVAATFCNATTSSKAFPQYWPTSGRGINIYAWYPSTLDNPSTTSGVNSGLTYSKTANPLASTPTFTVLCDQSTDGNYKASDLMWGHPDTCKSLPSATDARVTTATANNGNPVIRKNLTGTAPAVPLVFTHKLAKIHVVLKYGTGFWKEGKGYAADGTYNVSDLHDGEKLRNARVTLRNLNRAVTINSLYTGDLAAVSATTDSVIVLGGSVKGSTPGTAQNPTTTGATILDGYAIIPPQTHAASDLFWVVLADNATMNGQQTRYVYKLGSTFKFEGGKMYTFTITVNAAGLQVSTSINNWTDNAADHHEGQTTQY